MALVECVLGPATPYVAGHQFDFQRDRYGRFVAQVDDLKALACLLSVEHYRVVKDEPEDEPQTEDAADTKKPAVRGKDPAAGETKRGRKKSDAAPAPTSDAGDANAAPGLGIVQGAADNAAGQ
jgi:hypothetical protein